ncbi:DUF3073 domain-containing protein [Tessaracoccus flavus]|jgi:hypothetical protein|uniref:DUF3073 domain-containing protein n=1 Tax=Tessaracoccus flavus TaxID=1610493 RepID=A0A1Q2CCG1_9ACTN|nr:DUF3073 domain-containing protein [Tessaracoccus flavus]AQP43813.1 hypothetical protein RPIT_02415 [Tessaracoccus flavus]
MGRGRAKAKQTRVARDLKYRAIDTDFASLERELRGDAFVDDTVSGADDAVHEIPDAYADLAGDDYDDDYDERRSS